MRDHFLRGADAVRSALAVPGVAEAWDAPSVLADQTVGGLAGHLARGAVWVVGDYLDQPAPAEATIPDAATYFAAAATIDAAGHRAIRERGAAVAAAGPDQVRADLDQRLDALHQRLVAEPAERLVPVFGGTMRLDDYLVTRVVEQVVHLDDLARSLGHDRPDVPVDLAALVAGVGTAIGIARHGAMPVVRLLFRDPPRGVAPVLA